jgi:hypothetical protein
VETDLQAMKSYLGMKPHRRSVGNVEYLHA